MKRILIIIAHLLCISLYAQEDLELITRKAENMGFTIENPTKAISNISFVKVLDSKKQQSAAELYKKVESYFTYTYEKGDFVIQVKNEDDKYIIGKGLYSDFFHSAFSGWEIFHLYYSADHIVRIDCKDNKVRVIITIQQYTITRKVEGRVTNITKKGVPVGMYPINPSDKPERIKKRSVEMDNYICYKGVINEVEKHFSQIEKVINEGNSVLENQDW